MSSSAVLSRQGDEAGLRLGQLRGVGHSFHRPSAPRGLVEAGTSRLPWVYYILAEPNLGTEIPHVCMFSCVGLFVTLWTITCQAPLSIEFPKQEY